MKSSRSETLTEGVRSSGSDIDRVRSSRSINDRGTEVIRVKDIDIGNEVIKVKDIDRSVR